MKSQTAATTKYTSKEQRTMICQPDTTFDDMYHLKLW